MRVWEAGTGLGAGRGEIPAASAGMTDLVLRGCGELSRAGMAELCLCGYDEVGAGEGVLVGWGAVGVGLEVG